MRTARSEKTRSRAGVTRNYSYLDDFRGQIFSFLGLFCDYNWQLLTFVLLEFMIFSIRLTI